MRCPPTEYIRLTSENASPKQPGFENMVSCMPAGARQRQSFLSVVHEELTVEEIESRVKRAIVRE